MTAPPVTQLVLSPGGGKVVMRPVASTATAEALATMAAGLVSMAAMLNDAEALLVAMEEIGGGGGGGGGSVEVWAWDADGEQYVKVPGITKIFTEGSLDDIPPGMGEHDIWFRMVAPPS